MLYEQCTRILSFRTDPTELIHGAAKTSHRPVGLARAVLRRCRPEASVVSPFHAPGNDTLQQRPCVTVHAGDRTSYQHAAAARHTSTRKKLCKAQVALQVSGMQFRRRGRASLLPVAASGERHVNSSQVRKSLRAFRTRQNSRSKACAHDRLWPSPLEPWSLQPYTGSPFLFWQCHLR